MKHLHNLYVGDCASELLTGQTVVGHPVPTEQFDAKTLLEGGYIGVYCLYEDRKEMMDKLRMILKSFFNPTIHQQFVHSRLKIVEGALTACGFKFQGEGYYQSEKNIILVFQNGEDYIAFSWPFDPVIATSLALLLAPFPGMFHDLAKSTKTENTS